MKGYISLGIATVLLFLIFFVAPLDKLGKQDIAKDNGTDALRDGEVGDEFNLEDAEINTLVLKDINPSQQEIHNGDIIISEGSLLVTDKKLIINGNLVVNGTGKLIVKDSILFFNQDYNTQYNFKTEDSAFIDLDNSRILTNNKWMNVDFNGNTTVVLENYTGQDPNIPWFNSGWQNVRINAKNSIFGISVLGNSIVEAENSGVFFELIFGNASGVFELPSGFIEEFSTSVENDLGTYHIIAKNSTLRQWGTTIMYNSDITFVNSNVTIGMNGGASWPEYTSPEINVSGLKSRNYDFFELTFDTNHLKLINTYVTSWYPQAFGGAVMEISDSDLADLQWSGDKAKVIVRNTNMQIALARNNVAYYIYDSVINGDVTAKENGTIYLSNTQVNGNFNEVDNGRIFIDGTRLG